MSGRRRGFTLVDAMMAVTILGVGAGLMVGPWSSYRDATTRAIQVEGLAHVVDLELERARSCPTRACLQALPTTTTAADGAESWARAQVERVVREGPRGSLEIEIRAQIPGEVPVRRAATRVWRP
jgi:type II secretory pathway pseudopilin PulG